MTLFPRSVFVSPEWLAGRLDSVVVIDARSPRAYRELGHIPGAVNIPFTNLRDPSSVTEGMLPTVETFGQLLGQQGIEPTDPLVIYDDDRGVNASRILLTAAVLGHRGELRLLHGDISVWSQSHPVSTDLPSVEPSTYTTTPLDGYPVIDRSGVEAAIENDTILVDTRTTAEFAEAHIPGAVHLGWEAFVDTETRQLKSPDQLEAILHEKGLDPSQRLILYCNTARRLSHTYLVLWQLGYRDVGFYEGSLTDWIRANAPAWDPRTLRQAVIEHGPSGVEAIEEACGSDVFNRLKLVGLYQQKQSGYFMLRTKIPGGQLTTEQARVIGDVANTFARAPPEHGGRNQNPIFGDRYLDITTRQDVQMHWIRLEDMPEIWRQYAAVGLTTLQACGNAVRNVVACPAAGVDQHEFIDVRAITDQVTDRFLADRTYANLPRKFKVSITGCHENCARGQINDLAFLPAIRNDRDGFEVLVGGGLSDGPRMASDLEMFVEPSQVVETVEAVAQLFLEQGNYLNTAVNRLRFLVEELGVDTVRSEIAHRVSFPLVPPDESMTTSYRGDHVGIHDQEDGHVYAGLNVPTGRMLGKEFIELASLAESYGNGELRLTLNQNVLVPHLAANQIEAVCEEPLIQRYSPDPGPFSRGIVACTGSEYCNFGIIETKSRAIEWARALDAWVDEAWTDPPPVVRMHMSGCSASCAQPQIADIGFRGEIVRDERRGETEAVDIGLGGDLGRGTFTDWLAGAKPIDEVPEAIQRLLTAYRTGRRSPEEPFPDWLERTDAHTLGWYLTEPMEVTG